MGDNLPLIVGVCCVVAVLLSVIAIISISVILLWIRKRKEKVETFTNTAYIPTNTMKVNEAHDEEYAVTDNSYAYATTTTTAFMTQNTAYNAHKSYSTTTTLSRDEPSLVGDNSV